MTRATAGPFVAPGGSVGENGSECKFRLSREPFEEATALRYDRPSAPGNASMADPAASPEPELRMSRDEYRNWSEAQKSGRFERVDGVVVAMAPERAGHNDVKMLVWLALRQAVAAAGLPCHVYGDGMTVEVDDSDFEPDVVLHCGESLPTDAVAVPEPLVVAEVLSPGTRGDDLTRKLVAYFRVPSVQHYLVFWADRPQAIHHLEHADLALRKRLQGDTEVSGIRSIDKARFVALLGHTFRSAGHVDRQREFGAVRLLSLTCC